MSAFFPQCTRTPAVEGQAAVQSDELEPKKVIVGTQGNKRLIQGLQHSRGIRFPSSRRFLWDRTPAGAQVLINTKDHTPHVQLAGSAFTAVRRAAEQKKSSILLQLGLSITPTNQVTAVLQELDPLVSQNTADHSRLECPLVDSREDIKYGLRDVFVAQLEQRNAARVQQLYAICAFAEDRAGNCSLNLRLLMPSCSLLATPLYTKRLCNVPLAEALLKPGKLQFLQTGYLSMDQARSLLPMEATDVNVYSTPLVGVWVKGPNSVMHPLVAAACLRFVYSSLLADRAVNPDSAAFLLLLCPEGDPVSKCYEVCPTEPQQLTLSSYHLQASINQSPGVAQFPLGFMTADWLLDQQQPQPLQGHIIAAQHSAGDDGSSCFTPRSAGRSSITAGSGVSQIPAHGAVTAADSPVLMSRGMHSQTAYKTSSLFRSSAPAGGSAVGGDSLLQQYKAAAARRSLPAPGVATNVPWGLAAASGAHAADITGADGPQSTAVYACAVAAGEGRSSSEPEPRSGFSARPYGSPALQSWTAAGLKAVANRQQHRQQQAGDVEEQEAHQQLLQLGEQLLVEPSPQGTKLLCGQDGQDGGTMSASAATGVREDTHRASGFLQQHEQQQRHQHADVDNVNISTPRHPLLQQKQQQRYAASYEPAAGPADDSTKDGSPQGGFQVHQVGRLSPSVQAKVALSNLTLLQHLSTGQLEQAVDRVCSPTKLRSGSPSKAAEGVQGQTGATQAHNQQPGVAGSGNASWSAVAKPQTPDTEAGSVLGGSVLMGSPGSGPSSHHLGSDSAVNLPAAAVSLPCVRSTQLGTHSAVVGVQAAAALQAATAAVQRLNPQPYARSLGAQRYAADAAVFSSQDPAQPSLSGWVQGSTVGVGALQVCSSSPASALPLDPALLPNSPSQGAAAAGQSRFVSAHQQPGTDSLRQSLGQSLGAVDQSMVALSVAGNMLQPYIAPDGVMCLQERQQLAPTFWQDPVAQALQQEVDRLRQELLQVQQLLHSAVMPKSEMLALLPPDEPQPAMLADAQTTQEATQQASHMQHLPQQQQQTQPPALLELPPANSAEASHGMTHTTKRASSQAVSEQCKVDSLDTQVGQAAAVPAVNGTVTVVAQLPQPPLQPTSQLHDSSSKAPAITAAPANVACSSKDAMEFCCTSSKATPSSQQQQVHDHKQTQQETAIDPAGSQQCQQQAVQQHSRSASPSRQQDKGQSSPTRGATSLVTEAVQKGDNSVADANGGRSPAAAASLLQPSVQPHCSSSRLNSPELPVPSESPLKPTSTSSKGLDTNPGVAVAVRPRGLGTLGSAMTASYARSSVRCSLEVPPMIEVVRAKYCALDDDSDDSDREFEEKLMMKYGMKH